MESIDETINQETETAKEAPPRQVAATPLELTKAILQTKPGVKLFKNRKRND